MRTLVGTGSRITAFKGIFSGGILSGYRTKGVAIEESPQSGPHYADKLVPIRTSDAKRDFEWRARAIGCFLEPIFSNGDGVGLFEAFCQFKKVSVW